MKLSVCVPSCPLARSSEDGRANTRSLPWNGRSHCISSHSGFYHSKRPLPPGGHTKWHSPRVLLCRVEMAGFPGAAIPPPPACGSLGGLTCQGPEYQAQSSCDNVVLTIRLASPTSDQLMWVFATCLFQQMLKDSQVSPSDTSSLRKYCKQQVGARYTFTICPAGWVDFL